MSAIGPSPFVNAIGLSLDAINVMQLYFYCYSGDEIGMLEDMCVAVAELATVQFQVTLCYNNVEVCG